MRKQKRRTTKKIVTLEQRMLLIHSEAIKDYPWLQSFLGNRETVTRADCDELTRRQRQFLEETLPHLFQVVIDEWRADEAQVRDLGTTSGRCSLCHQPIRIECVIKNVRNRNELVVGKDCVENFGIRTNGNRKIDDLVKEARRVKRLDEITVEFPGIRRLVDKRFSYLDSQPILIRGDLANRYERVMIRLRKTLDLFLDEKINKPEAVERIQLLLDERSETVEQIENFVHEVRDHEFRVTRDIVYHLELTGNETALRLLKEDGLITPRTLHRIKEPGFLRRLVPMWQTHLARDGVTITNVHPRGQGYIYFVRGHEGIRLVVDHSELGLIYGPVLFGEDPVGTPIDLVAKSRIHDDGISLGRAGSRLLRLLRKLGVVVYKHNEEYDEIVIQEDTDRYVQLPLRESVERFKVELLGLCTDEDGLMKYVSSLSRKRVTHAELKDIEEIRKQFRRSS